jgi:hypothetical protein
MPAAQLQPHGLERGGQETHLVVRPDIDGRGEVALADALRGALELPERAGDPTRRRHRQEQRPEQPRTRADVERATERRELVVERGRSVHAHRAHHLRAVAVERREAALVEAPVAAGEQHRGGRLAGERPLQLGAVRVERVEVRAERHALVAVAVRGALAVEHVDPRHAGGVAQLDQLAPHVAEAAARLVAGDQQVGALRPQRQRRRRRHRHQPPPELRLERAPRDVAAAEPEAGERHHRGRERRAEQPDEDRDAARSHRAECSAVSAPGAAASVVRPCRWS